jgi:hypothetical protein
MKRYPDLSAFGSRKGIIQGPYGLNDLGKNIS